jgi:uncharacterized damage-inducible protein DinB
MSLKSQYQTLYAYHWYTRSRLFQRAQQLSLSDYQENPGYGHGSIHSLFFHLLRTEQSWRLGLETGKRLPPLNAESFPTLEALQTGIAHEQSDWGKLLDQLSSHEIEGNLDLSDRNGTLWAIPRWRILQHIILHGMQHHTELAQLLTANGQSPGDIDFIFFE